MASHMFTNVKCLIFDFDGTIIDTMFDYAKELADLVSKLTSLSYDHVYKRYLKTSGIPSSYQIREILRGYPDSIVFRINQEFLKIKRRILMNKDVYPEFRYVVNVVRRRGLMVFISSNLEQDLLDEFVATKGINVDEALGFRGESFMKGKPHIEYIINRYNLSTNNIIFIADSLKDVEYARQCNILFIGVEGTFRSEDFKKIDPNIPVISNLSQIIKLLKI